MSLILTGDAEEDFTVEVAGELGINSRVSLSDDNTA